MIPSGHKQTLIDLARKSIQLSFDENNAPLLNFDAYPMELKSILATFVTIKIENRLRGCIGTLDAYRPLVEDIADNAYKAAFSDPRFEPIVASEYKKLEIHISILSPPQEITFDSEATLLTKIQPNVDGLIIQDSTHKGTFLPSVWEILPDPKDFLRHLKQKAGFNADYWSDRISVFKYRTQSIDSGKIH